MAVEIKYVVIREGEEKMSFTSKKEADAYDKMLDLADVLNDWLVACPLTLEEAQRDEMALWLAERKETLHHILRTGKAPEAESETEAAGLMPVADSAEVATDEPQLAAAKTRKAKAA